MKLFLNTLLLLLLSCSGMAQDTTITLSPNMFTRHFMPYEDSNTIWQLSNTDGWLFRQGNDTAWAGKNINITGWEKRKPSELSGKLADKNGKLECWLRIKIKLDTGFRNMDLDLSILAWAATDIYIDSVLVNTFGNTGSNGKPFKEYNPVYKSPVDFNIEKGVEHTLAIHFVDFISPLPPHQLKSAQNLKYLIAITLPAFKSQLLNTLSQARFYTTIWLSVNLVLCLLFWLLAFQNPAEKNLLLIALGSTVITMMAYCELPAGGLSYIVYSLQRLALPILILANLILGLLIMLRTFKRKITLFPKIIIGILVICGIARILYNNPFISIFRNSLALLVYAYYICISWKTLKGAQWAVLTGFLLAIVLGPCLVILDIMNMFLTSIGFLARSVNYLSFPLSLLIYVAMRFKEIIKEVRQNAQQVVQLSEEKKEAALNQQKILQEEVNRQTAELRHTLDNLKATQSQLIHSEKMASLGELTAGIAHEIQNPLNFVNNFSDVNKELLTELNEEIEKGNYEDAKAIAKDVIDNEEKISHHGKRADAIVKGMLQHTRTSTGQKELTDINKLADEYLRLAYHGLRAKDKNFNGDMKTDFDESIGKISVVPQDIGRVLLNLFNNAFYAVNEKKKSYELSAMSYEPLVSVQTKKLNNKVEIRVSDNGNGIPQNIVDKIFQPFFTTKPTGQGTGLGLSLAYDIITKEHNGTIKVESKEGEGSTFIINLPVG